MVKIRVSYEEKELLKGYVRTTPLILIRLKCQAVLMRDKGMKIRDIADIVSRNPKTVGGWMKSWNKRRMGSIFTGHQDNQNASKLTKEQKEGIKAALAESPNDCGIPKEFWDVPALKEYVRAAFDVVYESAQSYHFLLSFSNLSFKYPAAFDYHRDEAQIERRMAQIYYEIRPLFKNHSWEIFAGDEVRIELEAVTRKAWLRRGERTVLKVDRTRESQSYLGLLNQKSFRCHLYELSWQNQEELLEALEKFLKTYPDKNICIIWDNIQFHRGKKIRDALKKGGLLERVHLINLPPYAPDRNPIEHVWNAAKASLANVQHENLAEAKRKFSRRINGRKFEYQI